MEHWSANRLLRAMRGAPSNGVRVVDERTLVYLERLQQHGHLPPCEASSDEAERNAVERLNELGLDGSESARLITLSADMPDIVADVLQLDAGSSPDVAQACRVVADIVSAAAPWE